MEYILPFAMSFFRYFFIAGIAFLIFYKLFNLKFRLNKIQKDEVHKNHFIKEILFSVQTIVIIATMTIVILLTPLKEFTKVYSDINEYSVWWIPVGVALSLVLHDAYFYWIHRTIHHNKLFKYIHLTHHKSTNPSPWTSYSFGLLEGILEALIAPLIMFLIPMHPIGLSLFMFIALFINVYGHLGYEIMPKWFRNTFLFEIINTSVHHNLHHEKFNGNYGLYFRYWDRIMKRKIGITARHTTKFKINDSAQPIHRTNNCNRIQ